MHCRQLVAVEASDLEEAQANVEEIYEGYENILFDFYSFGGRYSATLNGKDSMSYKESPLDFLAVLTDIDEYQHSVIEELRQKFCSELIFRIKPPYNVGNTINRFAAYDIKNLGQRLAGNPSFDALFMDGPNHMTFTEEVKIRCKKDPDKQWLIVLDLHM